MKNTSVRRNHSTQKAFEEVVQRNMNDWHECTPRQRSGCVRYSSFVLFHHRQEKCKRKSMRPLQNPRVYHSKLKTRRTYWNICFFATHIPPRGKIPTALDDRLSSQETANSTRTPSVLTLFRKHDSLIQRYRVGNANFRNCGYAYIEKCCCLLWYYPTWIDRVKTLQFNWENSLTCF